MRRIAAAPRFSRISVLGLLVVLVGCTTPTKPAVTIVRSVSVPMNRQVNISDHNSGNLENYTIQSETAHAVFENTITHETTTIVAWNDTNEDIPPVVEDPLADPTQTLTNLIGYGISTNGGSFRDLGGLTYPGFVTDGDPAVAVDGGGNFYFASLAISKDNVNWTPLVVARAKLDSGNLAFEAPVPIWGLLPIPGPLTPAESLPDQDKPLIAIDTDPGSSYYGTVYVTWSEFAHSEDVSPRILFTRSLCTDSNQRSCPMEELKFAPPSDHAPDGGGNHLAMPAVGPDGEVYVVWRRTTGTRQSIQIFKLIRGGDQFAMSKEVVAPGSAPENMYSGGINIRTGLAPYIAVDNTPVSSPTRGNVYVVYQADPDGRGPDRSDIFFTRSIDKGETWSTPRSINRAPAVRHGGDTTTNDNWQPFITVSPTSGEISVTFYDRRNDKDGMDPVPPDPDPPNTRIMLYRAGSTDGGITWFNEAVSDQAFKPATGYSDSFSAWYFGDYNYALASGQYFHYTWGDSRNLCTPPAAPAQPCSPLGRPDQDVFYAKVPVQEGPDLFITPWGDISGEGNRWESPDVHVVNDAGVRVSPKKGAINHLQVRIRNVGTEDAAPVQVRIRYAPLFAGLREEHLKEIPPITLPASEFIRPGGVKVVKVDWDLRDLSDTNDGKWLGKAVRDFTHFCVTATVSSPIEDSDKDYNNSANSNFVDVATETSGTSRFLIGNPHDTPVDAELILSQLPKGFQVKLQDFAVQFGRQFKLGARETKVATLEYSRPADLAKSPPKKDVVADISLRIGQEIVGGISVRLFRAKERREPFTLTTPARKLATGGLISATRVRLKQIAAHHIVTAAVAPLPPLVVPSRPPRGRFYSQTYRADLNRVSDVILAILREKKEPVVFVDRGRGLIKTRWVSVSNRQLKRLIPANLVPHIGKQSGRYVLGFRLEERTTGTTTVTVASLILVRSRGGGPRGGRPVASNGVLENEHLSAIARAIP